MSEPENSSGEAGASARREYQRRKAKHEADVRERHPHLGGVILTVRGEPEKVSRWARGAAGEQLIAQMLAKRCADVPVLHDRRIPGSRANIDHVAVAPTGVWVIDTKRYKGRVRVARPLFGKAKLTIDGRDQTKLIDALSKQVDHVRAALTAVGCDVAVHGCLCFINSEELPLLGTPSINGYPLVGSRRLAKRLNARGPLSRGNAVAVCQTLADRFPPA